MLERVRLWRLRQRDRAKRAAERAVLLAQVQRAEEVARKLQVTTGQHARARVGRRSQQQPGEGYAATEGRRRRQRPGAQDHGRRRDRYAGLPEEHVEHDAAQEDKVCPQCGALTPLTPAPHARPGPHPRPPPPPLNRHRILPLNGYERLRIRADVFLTG